MSYPARKINIEILQVNLKTLIREVKQKTCIFCFRVIEESCCRNQLVYFSSGSVTCSLHCTLKYIKEVLFSKLGLISEFGADGDYLTFKDWKKMLFILESCKMSIDKQQLLKKYGEIFKEYCAFCGANGDFNGSVVCEDPLMENLLEMEMIEHRCCKTCWQQVQKG